MPACAPFLAGLRNRDLSNDGNSVRIVFAVAEATKTKHSIQFAGGIYSDIPAAKDNFLNTRHAAETVGYKWVYTRGYQATETDFTADLKKFDVPTLVIHGDDDQIVPIDISGKASAKLVKGAQLIVYAGGPHGITDTHKARLNQDLLDFIRKN